jgi:hypothetical protein
MGLDDDEEGLAVDEEEQRRMVALCEEFEELCRELRYHQKE